MLAAADSGCSGHYLGISCAEQLTEVQRDVSPVLVTLPNDTTMSSTHTGLLHIPGVSEGARRAHLFPDSDIVHFPLLSIGQLCDDGCEAVLNATSVNVTNKQGHTILSGSRDKDTGLYMVPLPREPPVTQHRNNMLIRSETQANSVRFGVATMGSPPTATLLQAVEKGFVNIPGLTVQALRRHPPDSIATARGHLLMHRQGLRSTRVQTEAEIKVEDTDAFPEPPPTAGPGSPPPVTSATIFTKCIRLTQQNFTDLTGRFPYRSARGMEYMLIMFNEDGNYIHVELMRDRKAAEYARAYAQGLAFFEERGVKPSWERLDNETNELLQAVARRANIVIQYSPPGNHRSNRAERAIQTWKHHFISVLASTDPTFPMAAWDELVPQAELTLNLMRASRLNPAISAWAHLNGRFDFMRTPLAPAGTKVLAFETPRKRATWDAHGTPGFYVGPALLHYRCYLVYIIKTARTRVVETVSWHPADVIMPGSSIMELLTGAVTDLTQAVQQLALTPVLKHNLRQPVAPVVEAISATLRELQAIYSNTTAAHNEADEAGLQRVETNVQAISMTPTVDTHEDRDVAGPQRVETEQTKPPAQERGPPATPYRVNFPIPLITEPVGAVSNQVDLAQSKQPHPSIIQASPPRRSLRQGQRKARRAIALCATDYTYRSSIRHFIASAVDLDDNSQPLKYGKAVRGPEGKLWEQGQAEEWDRLVNTDTVFFRPASALPPGRKASYHNPQPKKKVRVNGEVEYRIRGTYGGDRGDYAGPTRAETVDMATLKILLNAVASEDAHFCTIDIRDFYLGTPLERWEYMWVPVAHLPESTVKKYNLSGLIQNGKLLVEIHKGIYGLKQAGRLAQLRLINHLAKHGYVQADHTPCLFTHIDRPISFGLVVDDFGVKYTDKADVLHLIACLEELYTLRVDWSGTKFVGFVIHHDRRRRIITMQMPDYIPNAVRRFGIHPDTYADNPGEHVPVYHRGAAAHEIPPDDTSPVLVSQAKIKRIQEIVGVVLYYARAVDPTLLTATSKVSSKQACPTEKVAQAAERLLKFAARRPKATIVFHASDMRLITHSDASYLSETGARSRVGGMSYLGSKTDDTIINGAIHCRTAIIDVIVASAAEAEYGGLFNNGQDSEGLRLTLADFGYTQDPTLLVSDNACACGIANESITQRRSKAFDMRFHWIRDRVRQGHFIVEWRPGAVNLADLFTKAQPTAHFLALRPFYVSDDPSEYGTRRTLAQLPPPKPATPKQAKVKRAKDLEHLRKARSSDFSATPSTSLNSHPIPPQAAPSVLLEFAA